MLARFLPNSGRDPSEGSASCVGGEETCRGGQNLWGHAAHRRQMDEVVSNTRSSCLNAKPKGRPRRSTLKGWQAAQMVRAIEDHCPDQLKLPYYLWTRKRYRICRKALRHTTALFGPSDDGAEWGFTPQKPRRRAFERPSRCVEQWSKKIYPLLHARANGTCLMYWGDEMDSLECTSSRLCGVNPHSPNHRPMVPNRASYAEALFYISLYRASVSKGNTELQTFRAVVFDRTYHLRSLHPFRVLRRVCLSAWH